MTGLVQGPEHRKRRTSRRLELRLDRLRCEMTGRRGFWVSGRRWRTQARCAAAFFLVLRCLTVSHATGQQRLRRRGHRRRRNQPKRRRRRQFRQPPTSHLSPLDLAQQLPPSRTRVARVSVHPAPQFAQAYTGLVAREGGGNAVGAGLVRQSLHSVRWSVLTSALNSWDRCAYMFAPICHETYWDDYFPTAFSSDPQGEFPLAFPSRTSTDCDSLLRRQHRHQARLRLHDPLPRLNLRPLRSSDPLTPRTPLLRSRPSRTLRLSVPFAPDAGGYPGDPYERQHPFQPTERQGGRRECVLPSLALLA